MMLIHLAAHDTELRTELRKMYADDEARFAAVLTETFPNASRERCQGIAYAVICLAEQNERFQIMGFASDRSAQARAARVGAT